MERRARKGREYVKKERRARKGREHVQERRTRTGVSIQRKEEQEMGVST